MSPVSFFPPSAKAAGTPPEQRPPPDRDSPPAAPRTHKQNQYAAPPAAETRQGRRQWRNPSKARRRFHPQWWRYSPSTKDVRQNKNGTESDWGAQVTPMSKVKERDSAHTGAKIVIPN